MKQLALTDFSPDGERCETCGRVFDTVQGLNSHIGLTHGKRVTVECNNCSAEISRPPSKAERGRNFCSESCSRQWKSENLTGENNPNYSSLTLTCDHCGESFDRIPSRASNSRRSLCSRKCRDEWMTTRDKETHPRWLGPRAEKVCDYCSDTFQTSPGTKGNKRFCSESCWRAYSKEIATGSNHHMWSGGFNLYRAVRRNIGDRSWREVASATVDEADGRCELCDERPPEQVPDSHHIIPLLSGGTNGDWNMMSLCMSCHRKVEWYMKSAVPELETVIAE